MRRGLDGLFTCHRCGLGHEELLRRYGWHFVRGEPRLDKFDLCLMCLDALYVIGKGDGLYETKSEARTAYRAYERS